MDQKAAPHYARGLLVGAVIVAILANAADFVQIDRSTGTIYAALNTYESPEVLDLALVHSETVRSRFLLYLELREHARGAGISLAPGTGLLREQLAGLAELGEIDRADGPVEPSEEQRAAIDAHLVAEGVNREAGEYLIAVTPGEVEHLLTLRLDERLFIVDARLLGEGGGR